MLTQTKIQIDPEDYAFLKKSFKDLNYKSLSDYIRSAIRAKIKEDRQKLRQIQRDRAMEMIGRAKYENAFESLDGEDFEDR